MRFITCTGYFCTGSSAITDFVSEFEDVCSMTDMEFRFLHDPDGVDDLEYHLVENHNRHNSGHALKRYKKLVDFNSGGILGKQYSEWFGNNWKKISYDYIDSLTDFTFHGWWAYDLYDKGALYWLVKRLPTFLLHMTFWRNQPERNFDTMKKELTYCSRPSLDEFIEKTKHYVEKLFSSYTKKDIVMVDQVVPPSNIWRYTRYFDDIKVVLVDRDPRDIFVLEKTAWKDSVIPHDDVETFCEWYKYTRRHRQTEQFDPDTVLFIYFEDMVFRYDEMAERLCEFLRLDKSKHVSKLSCFNPNVSRKNTRTWLSHPEFAKDVEYIEKHLSDYLYELPPRKELA